MEPNSAPSGAERGEPSVPKAESLSLDSVEAGVEADPAPIEVAPQSKESANQNQGATLPQVVTQDPDDNTIPAPVVLQQQDDDAPIAGAPTTANDVDVIEKEWVIKAKDIIRNTRDDPYNQEKQVSKLQADYLKKRYGKVVKQKKE